MRRAFIALFSVILCHLILAQQTPAPAAPPPPHTILDGTPIKLRLSQTMSSADAKAGQEVPFEVLEDLQVDGVIVLPKGAAAIGIVTDASPKKSLGHGGKLDIALNYARLVDQEKLALRAAKDSDGGKFLFVRGKEITIPEGTEVIAFVAGDMHLDMSKFAPAPQTTKHAEPIAVQASLTVESTPSGADINVDGNFVGDTPSTVNIAAGSHTVTVKKKGFANWSRTLNVTGGSIHLNAVLEKTTSPRRS